MSRAIAFDLAFDLDDRDEIVTVSKRVRRLSPAVRDLLGRPVAETGLIHDRPVMLDRPTYDGAPTLPWMAR